MYKRQRYVCTWYQPAEIYTYVRTFRPWTHTSDDSYIYQLSLVVATATVSSCLLETGVEYYLVCIREGLLCGKGMESPRGRGRLSGVRETQLFYIMLLGSERDDVQMDL